KIVAEYESLYRRNQELEKELAKEREKAEAVEREGKRLEEMIQLARAAAQDAKEAARREAEAIVREAKARAAQEIAASREQHREQLQAVDELKRQEWVMRRRLRAFLASLLDQVDEVQADEEEYDADVGVLPGL